ncbi:MAG: CDP-alcohol phosphatidyltransferase family protein [Promethearchaeota archaeon]|nr:MAG: CDP-alcohol phosphatidyltransferase family protein [Candidatus Lokiarchaeota archaeon]
MIDIIIEIIFPVVLLCLLILILFSGFSNEYKEEKFMTLDEFMKDWLMDHGQGHKLEKQFETMKKEPTGIFYMPATYKGAKLFMKLGLTPNKVSLINLISSFFIFYGVYMVIQGHGLDLFTIQPMYGSWFIPLAFLVLFTGIIDGIDGAMARLLGIKSKTGAWFDNVIDRISDILMLVGLIPGNILIISGFGLDFEWVVWTNCFLIQIYEYMRARHEGLGLHELKPFIGERPVRIMLIATSFMIYGISSFSVLITYVINPEATSLWASTHTGVTTWTILISQFILMAIMVLSSIQLGRYSFKKLKELDHQTGEIGNSNEQIFKQTEKQKK